MCAWDWLSFKLQLCRVSRTNADKQTINNHTERQTNRQTDRQTINNQTERQTNRQTDRQTERQTNRQTDRQTERQTNRQTDKLKKSDLAKTFSKVILQTYKPANKQGNKLQNRK